MAESVGMVDLRAENISKIVTGFALQEYRMKQVCSVQSSSAWKETYWKETADDLVVSGGNIAIEGVPRLAGFPTRDVTWTETSARLKKHGMEGDISWEYATTNEIAVITRTLLRIARAVTKSVDDDIWDVISDSQTAASTVVNTVQITAGHEWDSATIANRDPIDDILHAIQTIEERNYNPYRNGYLLLSPKDFRNIMSNPSVRNAAQFYTSDVTRNGRVGRLCGLEIIKSNSVTAEYALVIVGKEAATYKQAKPLSVKTIEDFGIKYTIRAWEVGVCYLTNPHAVCLISNTQA